MKYYKINSLKKCILILLFFALTGCTCSMEMQMEIIDLDTLYPETGSKGWEVNGSNTGYGGATLTTITPSDVDFLGYLSLVPDHLIVTRNNITITNLQIVYPIVVEGSRVIFDHCLIQPTTCATGVPIVRAENTFTIFRDCEFDFDLIPRGQVYMSIGIVIVNGVIQRCNIHGSSSGISIQNSSTSMASIAEGNYIHGLYYQTPAHVDGLTVRISSGMGMIIRNNYIITDVMATGALFMQAWAGYIDNVLVKGNLLEGYGYNLSLEYNTYGYGYNMRAINNRLSASAYNNWYTAISGGPGWYMWDENYRDDPLAVDHKGVVIPKP